MPTVDRMVEPVLSGVRVVVLAHWRSDELSHALSGVGAAVRVVTMEPEPPLGELSLQIAAGEYDAVLFTSAAAASFFLAEIAAQGVIDIVRDLAADSRLLLAAVNEVAAAPLTAAGLITVAPSGLGHSALAGRVIEMLGEHMPGIPTPAGVLRIRAATATLDHRPLAVSPTGLSLLRRLAREPGRVVTQAHLLSCLPGGSSDPHAAEVAVARLREAVAPYELIRTIVKRGYVLQVS